MFYWVLHTLVKVLIPKHFSDKVTGNEMSMHHWKSNTHIDEILFLTLTIQKVYNYVIIQTHPKPHPLKISRPTQDLNLKFSLGVDFSDFH